MRLPILKLENIPFWYKAVKRDTLFIALPFPPKFFSDLRAAEIFVSQQKSPSTLDFPKRKGRKGAFGPVNAAQKKSCF
jgi:hypothetical protein